MAVLLDTDLPDLYYRGKVRDTYEMPGDQLLLIATDRVSAFDVVLPTGIPDKGVILNQLSAFWFKQTSHIVPNHLIEVVDDVNWLNSTYGEKVCSGYYSYPPYLARRSMIVRQAERIDVECIVRGFLSGSGWADYQKSGSVCGIRLPKGLNESDRLSEPIFTPTTKAESGHDEPITIDEMKDLIGEARTLEIAQKSVAIYEYAAEYALSRGIIIADTKFEFGTINNKLIIIDELLTPDSSRFWDAETYSPGKPQPSFDKQPLRDWLTSSGWNMEPPAPELPAEVVEGTVKRYREAYRRITGKEL
ncbi:MAG: phosphoribosylaminoimidazolesuccinocarboxamide synthase [Dehalococcoidia bacterium]|nr:MAG: phosphoribosylaminoimidazolesuccinocarboxamide synthase [Dehalococcoidia bacterium]